VMCFPYYFYYCLLHSLLTHNCKVFNIDYNMRLRVVH
jgi:hypothetical protein